MFSAEALGVVGEEVMVDSTADELRRLDLGLLCHLVNGVVDWS